MSFDVLSNATTVGHQKDHLSLQNSNISKLIHDQGKFIDIDLTKPVRFLRLPMNRERSLDGSVVLKSSKNSSIPL